MVEEIYKINRQCLRTSCAPSNMETANAYLYKFSSKNFKPLMMIMLLGSMEDYQPVDPFVFEAFELFYPNLLGSCPPTPLQCY